MKKFLHTILSVFMVVLFFSTFFNNVFADNLNGWQKQDGKWYYYQNGTMLKEKVHEIDGKYYYFDSNGIMQSGGWYGIKYSDGYTDWIYANSDGSLRTGWLKSGNTYYWFDSYGYMTTNSSRTIDGKTYCFDKNGAMVAKSGWYNYKYSDNYTEWYYLNSDGTAVTGWKQLNGIWYYFNEYGMMCTGATQIDDKVYMFEKSGALSKAPKGWYKVEYRYNEGEYEEVSVSWYYLEGNNGQVATGWRQIDGKWYYFSEYGYMCTYPTVVNNKVYFLNNGGVWYKPAKGWYHIDDYSGEEKYTTWYYVEADGTGVTGWKKLDGNWYYFNTYSGIMNSKGISYIDGKNYCFNASGIMMTNYLYVSENSSYLRYFGADGSEQKTSGWVQSNGNWYYLNDSGYVIRNTSRTIGGKIYCFGKDGKMARNGWGSLDYTLYEGNSEPTQQKHWFYLNADGTAVTGWKTIGNVTYYFDTYSGYMYSSIDGARTIDDKIYCFNKSGAMIKNNWFSREATMYDVKGVKKTSIWWYYLDKDGAAVIGWHEIDGKNYYFEYSGRMRTNQLVYDQDGTYAVNKSGIMIKNDWFNNKVGNVNDWYYFESDGHPAKEWKTINGSTYYFDKYNGVMYTGEREIDGVTYTFDESGHLVK